MRLYVAGPASGIEGFNMPAFAAAAETLRAQGYDVVNPLERGADQPGWGWADYMRRSLRQMLVCDGVAVLENWYTSRGAGLEVLVAGRLRIPVHHVDHWVYLKKESA